MTNFTANVSTARMLFEAMANIDNSFVFRSSPQGHDYWQTVMGNLAALAIEASSNVEGEYGKLTSSEEGDARFWLPYAD